MKSIYQILIICLFFSVEATAQDYFFRQYGNEEGLHHPFVYSMEQDSDGFLWIGTGDGLYRFNGFEFERFTSEDGLGDNFITKLFRDRSGRIWSGHPNGKISVIDGSEISILEDSTVFYGSISDIMQDDDGSIWIVNQNEGLTIIDESMILSPVIFPQYEEGLSNIEYLHNDYFLIGTEDNVYLSRFNRASGEMELINGLDNYKGSKVVDILPTMPGHFIVVSQDEGFYCFEFDSITSQHTFNNIADNHDGSLDNLQGVVFDRQGMLWLYSMGNGLIKYRGNKKDGFERVDIITADDGLGSDNVRTAFLDLEGNLWFGMFGDGLLRYVDNNLSFYSLDMKENGAAKVYSITEDEKSILVAIDDHILRIDPENGRTLDVYPLPEELVGDRPGAIFNDRNGGIWLGMEHSGLYYSDLSEPGFESVYLSGDDLSNSVNFITGEDHILWVGTKNGICRINLKADSRHWFTTLNGLPHNNIQQLYIDSHGRVLIATLCSEIYFIDREGEVGKLDNSNIGPFNQVVSFAEDAKGDLWIATEGNGVWRLLDSTNVNYSRQTGILSDFCYSLIIAEDGMAVIGHRGGISSIDPITGMIKNFSKLDGIRSSAEFYANSVISDQKEDLWFGTSDGIIKYASTLASGSMTAPLLTINSLQVDGKNIEPVNDGIQLKAGYYEIKVDFVGINFTNPEMVMYQTYLEGYNRDWSDRTSIRQVVYDRLGHGNYTFRLRAYNENNVESEISSGFTLKIRKPVYLTGWFYTGIFGCIGLIFYIILKYRERQQKELQEFLQRSLDERTQEVVNQKERIELINKDITDSINYAQTIQASILPPIGKLMEVFTDAFVYYQPKDIVSGDFYWYDEVNPGKIVIVCADSTGHGVPGAFMSMIGTTLIKDICSTIDIESPSTLLENLDNEITTVLSQNKETGQSNDGMDLVAAEIDLITCRLKVASAISSLIIYKGQEQIYIRGSKNPIGGQYSGENKSFKTQVFQLAKGDKVYMYSDGYADQFGGPQGKKLKMSGLKEILEEIHTLPMCEQYNHLKNTFESWKKDTEQVDDVLFMGIEL